MSPRFTDPTITTEFRFATEADAHAIADLMAEFYAENELAGTHVEAGYDRALMLDWLTDVIGKDRYPHIIAIDRASGGVVGSIAYRVGRPFTKKPVCEVDKFFVVPKFRRGPIGRVLLSLAIDAVRAEGAVSMRIFINSGIPGTANIFRRFGFEAVPHSVLLGKEL